MEAANGLSCLEYAMRNWPALAYVCVYDSAATVDIFRAMTSRSFEMRKLLQRLFNLLIEFPDARALPVWQNRSLGYIADERIQALEHKRGSYFNNTNTITHATRCHDTCFVYDLSTNVLLPTFVFSPPQAFTKYMQELLQSSLKDRFPHLTLCEHKENKPPNAINTAAFAAQWTAKDDEDFDS